MMQTASRLCCHVHLGLGEGLMVTCVKETGVLKLHQQATQIFLIQLKVAAVNYFVMCVKKII